MRTSAIGLNRRTLGAGLLVFFLALAIPTAILIRHVYSELRWGAFHQSSVLAKELAVRINGRVGELIGDEEARSFSDYSFLNVTGDPAANFLQPSPLSAYPVASAIPGLIGYFQVDTQGAFSTPLLPQAEEQAVAYGISAQEKEQRRVLQNRIQQILGENRLVNGREADGVGGRVSAPGAPQAGGRPVEFSTTPASAAKEAVGESSADDTRALAAENRPPQQVLAQAAFDRLNEIRAAPKPDGKQKTASRLGRVEDLKLDKQYQAESPATREVQISTDAAARREKRVRRERGTLPEHEVIALGEERDSTTVAATRLRIDTFESEIDAFDFNLLDSGHFVLFRKVWRNGQRYIQGALIEQQSFLRGTIKILFSETMLSEMSDLIVAYQGDVVAVFGGDASGDYPASSSALSGALLYQTHLSDPLNDIELIFTINRLPPGPGATLINWVAVILLLVLCGGFYLIYRLGTGQIELARQQQDFVSAVSHELKTPLTSIRMYGEMLREGWASEEKKRSYYEYILDESERLSRLINNVLQLARLTRRGVQPDVKPVEVAELLQSVLPRLSSQIERAGFQLNLSCAADAGRSFISLDADYFTQILINLVDNALKFAASTDSRFIDIGCRLLGDATVQLSVRDYGPGVPKDQMKKIFRLFYRSESELTRETVGTGIGLALVHQLAASMNGQVDVVNTEPGAEFRVCFPIIAAESC